MQSSPFPGDPRYIGYADGRVYSTISKRFLKPKKTKFGYLRIKIRDLSKKSKQRDIFVHKIIIDCFTPPDSVRKFTHHRNSKRDDNRIENLIRCTSSENAIYKFQNGYTFKPSQKGNVLNYSLYHFKEWIGEIPVNAQFTGYHYENQTFPSLTSLAKAYGISCDTASTWFKNGKVRITLDGKAQELTPMQISHIATNTFRDDSNINWA